MKLIDAQAIAEAITLIEEAQDLVQQAIRGTNYESHFEAYGRYGFNQLLGNGNPYDSSLYEILAEANDEDEEGRYEYARNI